MTKTWQDVALNPQATVQDALATLDAGAMQIALVVENDNHLIGTVTDGDIRRALLRGKGLDTPILEVMNANPVTALAEESRDSWQRTMQRHSLLHLPLLDAQGCVIELAVLSQPEEPRRDNLVVLMAGGLGSRLRPLTDHTPKPLLEIGGKPILETIIESYDSQGFHRFCLCINYKGEMIRKHFGSGERWNAEIEYIEEKRRMGTAGALGLLPKLPDEPFFLMNGDLLTKVDYVRLLAFHEQQKNLITVCTREHRHQVPYGVVDLNEHRIVGMKEKPVQYCFVNAGIYVIEPEILKLIPDGQYFDMPDLINKLLDKNLPVGSFPLREYWMDVGKLEDFKQAHIDYPEQFE
jgi:dTDP-glucose pyrophosphorylase